MLVVSPVLAVREYTLHGTFSVVPDGYGTGVLWISSLLGSEGPVVFTNRELHTSRSGDQLFLVYLRIVRSDRVPRTVAKANVARVERWI